ncbi:MAG: hypothetical protein E7Z99_03570 [Coriobacteriaceae bacterium]|nr:hypothetical protein [Coriobacteriaceae bacterium]
MLLANASGEVALLIFSLLVPLGVTAAGLTGVVRGFATGNEEEAGQKADMLLLVPVAMIVIGLVSAILHVSSASHIFGMANGFGRSPLSNEIVVCGVSAAVAIVYAIVAIAKHPAKGLHLGFGAAVCVLGLVSAVFTGLAYMIPTVPTWNTAFAPLGQLFAALLGGSAIASFLLAIAGYQEAKNGTLLLAACGIVGALGAIAVVFAQAGVASAATSSAGATLSALMGEYNMFAIAGSICAVAGVAAWLHAAFRNRSKALYAVGCALAVVALFLIRIDFYGIFLNVGLF